MQRKQISPGERIYVFNYSESGALAVYRICKLRAKELSRDSKKADEYWGAFLGPGGSIYDVPGEQCGVDYVMKFCEDWYKSEWYDTRDYAEILKKENERNVSMGREENVAIFQDTEKMCSENDRLRESIKLASENQKLILEENQVPASDIDKYDEEAKIIVSKKRTFEAASAYKGMRVAVHNFASATNPGGGVVKGSTAQEECLCRCSTLYSMLNTKEMWNGFYAPHRNAADPIHNDDIIYTPGVVVFKTDTAAPVVMPETQWYEVDVITCAAPNLRDNPSNPYNKNDGYKRAKVSDIELLEFHEKRLRRILDVAVANADEVVILGAFGCGAFQNKPEIVARAAANVIGDYLHLFKNIEFAVYCIPRDSRNYDVFKRLLSSR